MSLINKNFFKVEPYYLFIYFYFFSMPWNYFKWQMGALTIILFIWWIIKFKVNGFLKLQEIYKCKPLLFFILFLTVAYISSLWSSSIADGFKDVNKYYKYIILLIPVLFTSLSNEEAKKSIFVFLVSFSCYSIFSLMIYLGLFSIEWTGSNSMNPKGIHAFSTSTQYMGLGALIAVVIALYTEKNKKIHYLLFILGILALSVNNSRTSQLSFLFSLLFISTFFYFYYYKLKLKTFIIYFVFVISIVLLSIFMLDKLGKLNKFYQAKQDVIYLIENNEYKGSLGIRLFMNKVGIETLMEHPILGVGHIDNNEIMMQKMKESDEYRADIISIYHSFHMDTLTKYGLLGYSLFSLSIIYLLINLYKANKEYFFIGLSVFTFLFLVSLSNGTLDKKPINYIYISLFLLLSIVSYKQSNKKLMENDNNNK